MHTGRFAPIKLFLVVMSVLVVVAKFPAGAGIDEFHAVFIQLQFWLRHPSRPFT